MHRLNLVLIFALRFGPLAANTFVTDELDARHCFARVLIKNTQTLTAPEEPLPISVFESEVLELDGCDGFQSGDTLYFAAPGAAFDDRLISVNGTHLEEGQLARVKLSEDVSSLGVHLLLEATSDTERALHRGEFVCSRSKSTGPSLYWKNRTIILHASINRDSNLQLADLLDAMSWSASQWTHPEVSDLQIEIGEPVDQCWVGYDFSELQANYNIVTVRTSTGNDFYGEWLHATKALAVTTLTYLAKSGEIIDADIELNEAHFEFTNCNAPPPACVTRYDLKNTLTHEFGHIIGLDHPIPRPSKSVPSVMYEESKIGETQKRIVKIADVLGLRFLYPKGAESGECFGVTRRFPPDLYVSTASCNQRSGSSNLTEPYFLMFIIFLIPHVYRFITTSFPARRWR